MAAYTAVTALAALFQEQFQLLRLRFLKNHVVVCGLGRKGRQLVRDFHEHGDRVVVIERDEGNDGISTCREDGIIVLLGDAADESLLRKARVDRAKYLIAICGDSSTNVEIAILRVYFAAGTSSLLAHTGADRTAYGVQLCNSVEAETSTHRPSGTQSRTI